MKRASRKQAPLARKDRLLVEELDAELLVYDLDRHRAHSLNLTAALIWNRCDGSTSVTDMARSLEKELDAPIDEGLVWFGIAQLERARLLVEGGRPAGKLSRRAVMKRAGMVAATTIPFIASITAPRSVEAGSCVPLGDAGCSISRPCCSGACVGSRCV